MDDPSEERRRAARQRSLLGAKFVCFDPPLTVDCTIRDLTPLGARLVLPEHAIVPGPGWLLDVRAGRAHECEMVWRAAGLRGVKFLRTLDVSRPLDGELNHLHRLWAEAMQR